MVSDLTKLQGIWGLVKISLFSENTRNTEWKLRQKRPLHKKKRKHSMLPKYLLTTMKLSIRLNEKVQ